jgi:predicted nucleic-acid-binding protein
VKIAIDTNVLVRYLTWDDESQAAEAAAAIEGADAVHISIVVLCELIWVLTRAYRYKANEIVPLIEQIVAGREFEVDQVAARTGLRLLAAGGDFADGATMDDMRRASCEFLVTFDREFARLLEPSKVVLLGK